MCLSYIQRELYLRRFKKYKIKEFLDFYYLANQKLYVVYRKAVTYGWLLLFLIDKNFLILYAESLFKKRFKNVAVNYINLIIS